MCKQILTINGSFSNIHESLEMLGKSYNYVPISYYRANVTYLLAGVGWISLWS